jgi:hypothetical protein
MLRRLLPAGVIVALMAGPAFSQPAPSSGSTIGIPLNPEKQATPDDIERQKAAERAYNAAIQKIPDKKPSADPWGTIRPNSSTTAKSKQSQ